MRSNWLVSCMAALAAGWTAHDLAHAEDAQEQRCLECHSEEAIKELPVTFADKTELPAFINKDAFLKSPHGDLACGKCHRKFDATEHPGRTLPGRRQYATELNQECLVCHKSSPDSEVTQVTDVLHSKGTDKTPLCSDCHAPHTMGQVAKRDRISEGCVKCHGEIYASFSASVHGAALRDPKNHDVPVCTECHLGHRGGGKSLAASRIRRGSPCIGCHRNEDLMRKYSLSTSVVKSYLKDFHGVSVKFYGENDRDIGRLQLVCADCHGIHNVKPAKGNAAVAMRANLLDTCRKCHPNATENFPSAWLSHYEPSLARNPIVFLVEVAYWILIPFVIVGLTLHIVFHFFSAYLRGLHKKLDEEGHAVHTPATRPPHVPPFFKRFTVRQRLEHLVAVATFAILVITGFPQMYHDASWADAMVRGMGGIDLVRFIHRVAGYTFVGAAVVHFAVAIANIMLRKTRMTMLPVVKDFRDAVESVMYHLGLLNTYPRFDRYDFRQKFEYWGLVLGSVVMAGSGFILIFPTWFAQFLPGQFIAAAKVAHSYEAMMALLTIVIWHMYGARFETSIFTGKVSAEQLAHHHTLEYERLVAQLQPARPASHSGEPTTSLATNAFAVSQGSGAVLTASHDV